MTEPQQKGPPRAQNRDELNRLANKLKCRKWRHAHREQYNAYQREYMRQWRAQRKQAAGRKIVADALAKALGVDDEQR